MNKETCPNKEVFVKLPSSFDRMDEAAWFIRLMEENYHNADKFRWSLNSFLRTLKEIMQVVTVEVQHDKKLIELTAKKKAELSSDPLLSYLFKQRDIVVHQSMLKPLSKGYIGFTRGRGLKLGVGLPIDPLVDSVQAILKYISHAAKSSDFMGILYTEEDGSGEYTCVKREWKMSQFPNIEITQLAANAWEKVAQAFFDIAAAKGAQLIKPTFKLGDPNIVHFEIYRPEWVNEQLQFFKQESSNIDT
jgi:hypothetical protein